MEDCEGCTKTAELVAKLKTPLECMQCEAYIQYEGVDSPCDGCVEVATQLRAWCANDNWGSPLHEQPPDTDKPQASEWMRCTECDRVVVIRKGIRHSVNASLRSTTWKNPRAPKLPEDIEAFLGGLKSGVDYKKLERLRFYQPRAEFVISWLLKNQGSWDLELCEKLGFATSFLADRWLALGPAGRIAAAQFGERLLQEAATQWHRDYAPIPLHYESSAGSLQYGRSILLFELDECNNLQWVSLRLRRLRHEKQKT